MNRDQRDTSQHGDIEAVNFICRLRRIAGSLIVLTELSRIGIFLWGGKGHSVRLGLVPSRWLLL